jgi:predicted amidophosphoribosyltransferase|tara:strand:- start:2736 stop:3092 length:357 start_codon:yes stop_codon:yes gene_type:complete
MEQKMTNDKFVQEIEVLKSFFIQYCKDNHQNKTSKKFMLMYNSINYTFYLPLCGECNTLISYSFDRLSECPHTIKPRCRKCPNSCYKKEEWKKLAKVMKYSAIKLGLSKIKNLFRFKK